MVSFTDGRNKHQKCLSLSGHFLSTKKWIRTLCFDRRELLYTLPFKDIFICQLTPQKIQVESLQFPGCNLNTYSNILLFHPRKPLFSFSVYNIPSLKAKLSSQVLWETSTNPLLYLAFLSLNNYTTYPHNLIFSLIITVGNDYYNNINFLKLFFHVLSLSQWSTRRFDSRLKRFFTWGTGV